MTDYLPPLTGGLELPTPAAELHIRIRTRPIPACKGSEGRIP